VTNEGVKKILTIVIALRHRIEERAKDPAQDASGDEGEAIGGEDTNPSTTSFVSDVTPSKTAADYSAFFFLILSRQVKPSFW